MPDSQLETPAANDMLALGSRPSPEIMIGTYVPFELSSGNAALIIVDMTRACADQGLGWARMYREMGLGSIPDYYLPQLRQVTPRIRDLTARFRERRAQVVYTTLASEDEEFRDLPERTQRQIQNWSARGFSQPYPRVGEDGAEIIPDLGPQPGDLVINKTGLSAFHGTQLRGWLEERSVKTLAIAGMATSYCVGATLLEAYDFGYNCVLVEDATASLTPDMQEIAVAFLAPFARIASTEEVLREV